MKSKKGMELSINMLVVVILGIILLTTGTSIFFKAYNKTVGMKEDVDTETRKQLEALLIDSGSTVVMPITTRSIDRGKFGDFNLGINNELGAKHRFRVNVSYIGNSRNHPNPFISCAPSCGALYLDGEFELLNNERYYMPIRIQLPKNTLSGQYIFAVDVWRNASSSPINFVDNPDQDQKYGSRQQIVVNVK